MGIIAQRVDAMEPAGAGKRTEITSDARYDLDALGMWLHDL
jgi:hypothetical protein